MKREPRLYSQLIRSTWLHRTVRLSGQVEVIIDYDATAFGIGGASPTIRINGEPVIAARRGTIWSRHRLLLPAIPHCLTPVLEVEFTKFGLVQFRFIRLSIGAEVLYEEDRGTVVRILEPPPLPIPSQTPTPEPTSLPIASEPWPTLSD